jgi:hypothetical protein
MNMISARNEGLPSNRMAAKSHAMAVVMAKPEAAVVIVSLSMQL